MSKIIVPFRGTADPFAGAPYRICKRPNVGELVATRFGVATIVEVGQYGRKLTVDTPVHGREIVERHPIGHWTIKVAA